MKLNKKIATHAIICSMIFLLTIVLFVALRYIDFSVIRAIYLPIYAFVITAILFKQYIFGYIFIISAGLGLITEYIIHLNPQNPNMSGAFLNTLIIFLGFIIGVIVQIFIKKIRK